MYTICFNKENYQSEPIQLPDTKSFLYKLKIKIKPNTEYNENDVYELNINIVNAENNIIDSLNFNMNDDFYFDNSYSFIWIVNEYIESNSTIIFDFLDSDVKFEVSVMISGIYQ